MSTPDPEVVRQRILEIPEPDTRMCVQCAYLFCARISEVVGYASPKDNTTARGEFLKVSVMPFRLGSISTEAAVFHVATAKRGGKERLIALPLDQQYEPWTQGVVDYFKQTPNPKFPFTRQFVGKRARKAFVGLTYPIDTYTITKGGIKKKTLAHNKPFRLHALRHLRTTELLVRYGFDPIDLSQYGGWTLRSMAGIGSSMERYAHLDWQRYFPKLLIKSS